MSVNVSVVTTGRADYGLLRPLMVVLREDDRFELSVLATGSHLVAEQGMTVNDIVADGFDVTSRVELPGDGDDRLATAHATGDGIRLIADALAASSPDIVVILGDRFEAFAAASAAAILDIPVAHIHGGELTFGSLDDAFRHAITKLATLHFASTEVYRKRIVQMGEPSVGVFNSGALAVDNVRGTELLDEDEFESVHGVTCDGMTLLVTFHPVTRGGESLAELEELLSALDLVPEFRVLFTAPNLDAGGRAVRSAIESWVDANSARADLVTVLGWRGYLSAAKNCAAVVGNSSSGLIEVPALGVPSVDIGHRQTGRLRPDAVVHCAADADSIAAAIRHATSAVHREVAATASNPYGDGHTADRIAAVLADTQLLDRVRIAGFGDIDF